MAKHESVWSWVTSRIQGMTQRRTNQADVDMQEENPWFSLHSQEKTPSVENRRAVGFERTQGMPQDGSSASPRWLSNSTSPYGFSDDDGTLKQVDSHNWQSPREGTKPKRFIASSSNANSRWQQSGAGSMRPHGIQRGSTWMLQLICSIVIVAGAMYAHQGHTSLANRVESVYQDMFEHDYAQSAMPSIRQFLDNHHISMPAIGAFGAVRLHPPLVGTIETDYSTTHPEMVLSGTSGEAVNAAGSGTVTKVVQLSSGTMIRIDHGSLGVTTYVGLADASVKQQEFVSSGQIIGHLPKVDHPQLEFTLEKQGHYVDPHDEINFSSNTV